MDLYHTLIAQSTSSAPFPGRPIAGYYSSYRNYRSYSSFAISTSRTNSLR